MSTKKFYRIFWIIFISPIVFIFLLFTLINLGAFGFMPSFDALENPKTNIATEIYSADQQLLGKFFKENRTVVSFTEVSSNVLNALIATEDLRFYEHSGVDGRALMRVVKGVLTGNSAGGGSTVTQQLAKNLFPRKRLNKMQLVIRKLKEWIIAVKLERNYTKQEIMAMYLNTVDFGSQAYGIKSAARTFFNASPDSLKIEEAAVLVGLLKAPTKYSPAINPKNAFRRRNVVLSQIEKNQNKLRKLHGYIPKSKQYYDSLKKLPIKLSYSVQSHKKGIARYFREYIRAMMTKKKPVYKNYPKYLKYKYYEDSTQWANNPFYGWCNKNKKPDGKYYNLYSDGLKIYTTVNYRMQDYAEKAVKKHMGKFLQPLFYKRHKGRKKAPFSYKLTDKQINNILYSTLVRSERYRVLKSKNVDSATIQKIFDTPVQMRVFSWKGDIDTIMSPRDSIRYYKYFLQAGLMSIEPQTGYVRAYVGGVDYNHFRFDHVTQSRRQVGSTIKPIVYSVAMKDGLSPCYKVPNIPVTFQMPKGQKPPEYTPKYSKNKREGEMVSLKYGLALSLNQISAWVMKRYGPLEVVRMAKRVGIKSPLDTVYALCVGAAELRLSEMVSAYDTYVNKGMYVEPIYVTRIEDKNGNTISTFRAKKNQALDENTAYRMIQLMRGVVDMGTSVRLRYTYGFTNQIAGKTGTTNDNSDGWFIGMVPNLVTGVWVGGEERSIRFLSSYDGQGSAMALPIWAYYMQKVYKDKDLGISKAPFPKPRYKDGVITDCDEYDDSRQNDDGNYDINDGTY